MWRREKSNKQKQYLNDTKGGGEEENRAKNSRPLKRTISTGRVNVRRQNIDMS